MLSPLYLQLFNLIGQLEGGVKFLVDLRADLLVSFLHHNYSVSVAVDLMLQLPYSIKFWSGKILTSLTNFANSSNFSSSNFK